MENASLRKLPPNPLKQQHNKLKSLMLLLDWVAGLPGVTSMDAAAAIVEGWRGDETSEVVAAPEELQVGVKGPCALTFFCNLCAHVPAVKQQKNPQKVQAGAKGAVKRLEAIRSKQQQNQQQELPLPQEQQPHQSGVSFLPPAVQHRQQQQEQPGLALASPPVEHLQQQLQPSCMRLPSRRQQQQQPSSLHEQQPLEQLQLAPPPQPPVQILLPLPQQEPLEPNLLQYKR